MTGARVLVVPRESLPDGGTWHGLRSDGVDAFLDAVRQVGRFEDRAAMEADPRCKQIIPYLVLRDGPRYFLMRRSRAGGDARLFDRCSIGVGGHIDPGDADVLGGLRREWAEELDAPFEPEVRPIALLNDDTTEVGAVHVGIVFVADAAGRPVAVRERDKLAGSFVTPDDVRRVIDQLESWSRIVFEAIESGALRAGGTATEER